VFHGGTTTIPPAAPGSPLPVFWGFGWPEVGFTFVAWNVTGLLVLLCACASVVLGLTCGRRVVLGVTIALGISLAVVAMFGILSVLCLVSVFVYQLQRLRACPQEHRRRCRFLLGANLALYVFSLVPYVASGALSHGWAGGYVHGACDARMEAIANALAAYAKSHDGKLPKAASIEELIPKIQPDLDTKHFLYHSPVTVCPLGAAYERRPRPYEWNRRYSDAPAVSVPELPEAESDFLLRCPYHKRAGLRGHLEFTRMMLRKRADRE
jgi:hypothetical protein